MAAGLEKNATLQTLDLRCEFFVVCFSLGEMLIVVYVLWVVFCFVVVMEGRVRGVDCVCATEPPCSSDCQVTDAGAAAIARALEKNTTLQSLSLGCEMVVFCCFLGGGWILVYVVVCGVWFAVCLSGRLCGVCGLGAIECQCTAGIAGGAARG